MKISRIVAVVLLSVAVLTLCGCFGGVKNLSGEKPGVDDRDVPVEAYLFDVKIRRQGKPTTIRLDLYQTDTVVAMYGRGYFNKGAFGGRLTSDSMLIYFPSTEEYLFETIENLFLSFDCESELIGLNLLGYFLKLPDSGHISENLIVKMLEEKDNTKKYEVRSASCPWLLNLEYVQEERGWRIDKFEFDDAKDVTIKGDRRRYKENASVSSRRFRIEIPPSAFKITL